MLLNLKSSGAGLDEHVAKLDPETYGYLRGVLGAKDFDEIGQFSAAGRRLAEAEAAKKLEMKNRKSSYVGTGIGKTNPSHWKSGEAKANANNAKHSTRKLQSSGVLADKSHTPLYLSYDEYAHPANHLVSTSGGALGGIAGALSGPLMGGGIEGSGDQLSVNNSAFLLACYLFGMLLIFVLALYVVSVFVHAYQESTV